MHYFIDAHNEPVEKPPNISDLTTHSVFLFNRAVFPLFNVFFK